MVCTTTLPYDMMIFNDQDSDRIVGHASSVFADCIQAQIRYFDGLALVRHIHFVRTTFASTGGMTLVSIHQAETQLYGRLENS